MVATGTSTSTLPDVMGKFKFIAGGVVVLLVILLVVFCILRVVMKRVKGSREAADAPAAPAAI